MSDIVLMTRPQAIRLRNFEKVIGGREGLGRMFYMIFAYKSWKCGAIEERQPIPRFPAIPELDDLLCEICGLTEEGAK